MSAPDRHPVGLRDLLRAGLRSPSDYTGMTLGLFLVQMITAFGSGWIVKELLASVFASKLRFDDAVDGDLVALVQVLRGSPHLIASVTWVSMAAVATWAVLSWFLAGGVIAVLAERPHGRREVARCFGAGGANTFFVYARLGLLSIVLEGIILMVTTPLLGKALEHVESALTMGELLGPLALALAPGVLATLFLWVVVDHARVELTLRSGSHDGLGAVRAFGRALVFVLKRPLALLHVGLYWLGFVAVTVIYVVAAHDHLMLGTSGAIALLVIREGLGMARFALKIGLIGGQVALGATRPAPPRQD